MRPLSDTNAGPWVHSTDGTPCPACYASTPRSPNGPEWWCTEHQQHVRSTSPRMHWAHPVETIPACMVVGTWVRHDEEVRATAVREDVTCVQCGRIVGCDTCGRTGLVPWMSESDPNGYQERDYNGMVPCPDCTASMPREVIGQVQARIVRTDGPVHRVDYFEMPRPSVRRLARWANGLWKWRHGLHGTVIEHRGQMTGEIFYGCDRGHITRKRR